MIALIHRLIRAELPINIRLMGVRMSTLRKKGVRNASDMAFDRFFKRSDPKADIGMHQCEHGSSYALSVEDGDLDGEWECMPQGDDGIRATSSLNNAPDVAESCTMVSAVSARPHDTSEAPERLTVASQHHSNLWTCGACTFAGNLNPILRCSVCDTLKGYENSEMYSASVSFWKSSTMPKKLTREGTVPIDQLLPKKPKP